MTVIVHVYSSPFINRGSQNYFLYLHPRPANDKKKKKLANTPLLLHNNTICLYYYIMFGVYSFSKKST